MKWSALNQTAHSHHGMEQTHPPDGSEPLNEQDATPIACTKTEGTTVSQTAPPLKSGPSPLTRPEIAAWRNAVFVIFALSGVGMASWIARTPAIRDSLGASTFQMGLIVFGLAAGSIVGLTTSSHVLATIGSANTIRASAVAAGFGLAITGIGATATITPLVVT